MLYNSLTVLVISLTVLICLTVLSSLSTLLFRLINSLSSWFASKKVLEEGEEEFEDVFVGKYDVDAFRERMRGMTDENGLYDVYENSIPPADFTGVEIVTNSREMDIDNRVD